MRPRSLAQEVSLYSQAVSGKSREDGGGESTSESDFVSVGGEEVWRSRRGSLRTYLTR